VTFNPQAPLDPYISIESSANQVAEVSENGAIKISRRGKRYRSWKDLTLKEIAEEAGEAVAGFERTARSV
jgi:hypothetical protein